MYEKKLDFMIEVERQLRNAHTAYKIRLRLEI